MNNKTWLTKQDIINDLAKVTGRSVTNIDDRFALRGERPPPITVPDEDEYIQMYGQYAHRDSLIVTPDLSGITHMLRMVNEYYDCATYDDNENIKELKKAANTVIAISKLNPNVPEFIPQNVKNNESAIIETESESSDGLEVGKYFSKGLDIKHLACNNYFEINKTDASHKNEANDNDIDVTKKIDVSGLNFNDIKNIKEKLKLKIGSTSKAECLNKKRERNLAMASLLKLYTEIPKSPKNDSPLNLMTPEYFENFTNNTPSNHVDTVIEQNKLQKEVKKETKRKNYKHVSNITDCTNEASLSPRTTSQESTDLSDNTTCEPNLEKQTNGLHMTKEVQESVKKVDKWLNGPERTKHKSRAICFGPVTFRKKESSTRNSSEISSYSVIDNTESPSSAHTSDSFVPSAYANELTTSYMERSKAKAVQHEDIWTKLERQMQEKDKAIKEQLLSTQAQK